MKTLLLLLFIFPAEVLGNTDLFEIFSGTNNQQALDQLLPLANQGNPEAQYYVSLLYTHGKGIENNSEKALDYMWLAAELREPAAVRMLATFYFTGRNTEPNYKMAYKLYKNLAMAGDRDAQILLGALLTDEKYLKQNLREGVAWLLTAQSTSSLEGNALNNYNKAKDSMSNVDIDKANSLSSDIIKTINRKSLTNSSSGTTKTRVAP